MKVNEIGRVERQTDTHIATGMILLDQQYPFNALGRIVKRTKKGSGQSSMTFQHYYNVCLLPSTVEESSGQTVAYIKPLPCYATNHYRGMHQTITEGCIKPLPRGLQCCEIGAG